MSGSSSTSSYIQGGSSSSSRPQQYGLVNSHHDDNYILRQRPGDVLDLRSNRISQQPEYRIFHHSSQTTASVSPFLSPASSFDPHQQHYQREQLPPLILDPCAQGGRNVSNSLTSNESGQQQHNNFTIIHKLWEVASGKRQSANQNRQQQMQPQQHIFLQEESTVPIPEETAGHFARVAPRAGFLQKLGTTIPEFKRRFFVLQPGTHLYYFLSPNDTEPRGCFDLDGSIVEEVDHLPDGRYRFALLWDEHRIVLEARSKEVGQEWIQSLQTERLSYVRGELHSAQHQNDVLRFRVSELENRLKDYHVVEGDRDAAMEDAARWKEKFEQLDDALRLLAKQMLPPDSNDGETEVAGGSNQPTTKCDDRVISENPDGQEKEHTDDNETKSENENSGDEGSANLLNTSLLDSVGDEDEAASLELQVPGSNFSMLSTACQQLRDYLTLSKLEASATATDLNTATEKIAALEKRLASAEKHLCKLWEENCTIRNALKQKKAEKKILVREYKSLAVAHRALQAGKTGQNGQRMIYRDSEAIAILDVSQDDGSFMAGSEEDRLMNEIEESVVSSIRIHEQLLGSARALCNECPRNSTVEGNNDASIGEYGSSKQSQNQRGASTSHFSRLSKDQPQQKISSLLDESEDSDEQSSVARSHVSKAESDDGDDVQSMKVASLVSNNQAMAELSQISEPDMLKHPNPMLRLDDGAGEDDDDHSSKPRLCATSSQSESSKSMITDNGRATARLACPLADVVPTQYGTHDASDDGRVYHLTFHTRKIGIQFQKVPPPSAPIGLLTEAMRVDLGADSVDGQKAAADLRKTGRNNQEESCTVATPIDAVLVCGLTGFDDSMNRIRPKLGARLVAFDGISVEAGQWTFDSIRKAIQARGRPLTLSFRNDFLTTEQRTILTKAIADEGDSGPPRRAAINYVVNGSRPSSTDPSVHSSLSHESDYFVNQGDFVPRTSTSFVNIMNDDMSSSAASDHSYPPTSRVSFAESRHHHHHHHTPGDANFRSFSEAGSSSVFSSSSIAPLMANLMANVIPKNKQQVTSFTPEYMRREAGSLDNTPQHHDFKSNLL